MNAILALALHIADPLMYKGYSLHFRPSQVLTGLWSAQQPQLQGSTIMARGISTAGDVIREGNAARPDAAADGAARQARNRLSHNAGDVSKATHIPIPLVGGSFLTLEGAFPVSQLAWKQFLAVLAAMEPGLVEAPSARPDASYVASAVATGTDEALSD